MLKLYVLRHGKAVRPKARLNDFDRRLNRKGVAQVNQVGYILRERSCSFDEVIASGAQRTRETATIIRHFIPSPVHYDDGLYLTDADHIQTAISEFGKGKHVLYVGHNNGISDFVTQITGEYQLLSTSMLVEISFNFDSWQQLGSKNGQIESIITPDVCSF
jgi:phosphohistidine phosphatase